MKLDVIIPTHNRAALLRRTLDSLLAAEVPAGLVVRVTVVDNNSKDSTRQTVESYSQRFGSGLGYVFESRQGRSFALNAGITSTTGDLVGMIDDDEEIDASWYSTVTRLFNTRSVDFIGGPYVPRWGAARPDWLPMNYIGAIGWIDGGERVRPFDESYPGILMGGNAVITRPILNKVGLYDTRLGRSGSRLLAGEDEDMYRKLLAAGARGLYVPELIIYHYIPPERLMKRYFRDWCFWRGVSAGLIDRNRQMPVVYFAGVPRYLYGDIVRGIRGVIVGSFSARRDPAKAFSNELGIWDAAGFFYGKHFYRSGSAAISETVEAAGESASNLSRNSDIRQVS
jgi:glycosyltransferase involved in cell wall biosynthesis